MLYKVSNRKGKDFTNINKDLNRNKQLQKDINKSFFFIISSLLYNKINYKDGKYSTIKYFLDTIILLMNINYNRNN